MLFPTLLLFAFQRQGRKVTRVLFRHWQRNPNPCWNKQAVSKADLLPLELILWQGDICKTQLRLLLVQGLRRFPPALAVPCPTPLQAPFLELFRDKGGPFYSTSTAPGAFRPAPPSHNGRTATVFLPTVSDPLHNCK